MNIAKKGSGFMNIFSEETNSDPAKIEFNLIMNRLIIKNIHINDLTYQSAGLKSREMYDNILKFYLKFENKCTQDDKDFLIEFSNT